MGVGNRREDVYLSLRTAIIENALQPGTKLPEDSLGASLGVSRTIIREALARLRSEGLVETGKGKSATVALPGPEESAETFHVRRCLEKDVVALLADNWDPVMGQRLRAHIELEQRASAENNYPVSDRLGVEFHILMAELTSNRLLHKYMSEVALRCALIIAVHGHDHNQDRSIAEHTALVEALESGDSPQAAQIVDEHLIAVQQRALRPPPPVPNLAEILNRYSATG
ncbi:transcriptional regulator, GntR family [Mycolicibacterium canariasense]|uniref:Transcriptional regulator, GntR family n=1 Tax=Mycolicibacterium canariasense TaxID=228230 RepID=A0A100W872_MYCCR|nr:transcriptional regulator, GntR family [Mycolicibacterium canariasense]